MFDDIAATLGSISRAKSRTKWRLAIFALAVGLAGFLWLAALAGDYFAVTVASSGGALSEGIVGSPRFINPLLATSDADRDLTTLIYSGLVRINERGAPEPDLAESFEISPDGLIYTFHLKPDLLWHDGETLSATDVEFTVLAAQDPLAKSSKRASWEGVRVEVIDERTIRFKLKEPYPSFLETAATGILPKHIWGQFDLETFPLNQFNTESIGSGPYRIKEIKRDALGLPKYYDLAPFRHFALGQPRISRLRLYFYPNEAELLNAYQRGEIEAGGAISAGGAKELELAGKRVLRAPQPRVFGVFFNQNLAPALAKKEVRQALNMVIDREAIINEALKGYGLPASGPLPDEDGATATSTKMNAEERLAAARDLLAKKGWTWNENKQIWEKKNKQGAITLQFSLTTSDTAELKRAAELIRAAWAKLGARVDLKVFELGDLNQNVIRPRQYDALFFGEILGRNPDLFAFWHSSQRLDPGLNIALYANIRADKLLEEARRTLEPDKASERYRQFAAEVENDMPAVFVYSPVFLYLLPEQVKNANLPPINTAADRFSNIHRWYITTDRVWPLFADQNHQPAENHDSTPEQN